METLKMGFLGLDLVFIFFLIYFNDVSKITDNGAQVVPYADNTSIRVTPVIKRKFKKYNQNTP
jgi:hypothetical protein